MIFILLFGMYFPSLFAAWAIMGIMHGISIVHFYNLFTLKEYKNNKSDLVSGLLFTENPFRLVVLTVLLILILVVNTLCKDYLLHMIVIFILYVSNITYNMYKAFGKKNRIEHSADELFKDIMILKHSLNTLECSEKPELEKYALEILEKFWDCIDRHEYNVELDSNGRIKFTLVENKNSSKEDSTAVESEKEFAQYNFEKLKKGIFNFKIEISEYK